MSRTVLVLIKKCVLYYVTETTMLLWSVTTTADTDAGITLATSAAVATTLAATAVDVDSNIGK